MKLLILGGPHVPADEMSRLLGGHFEVLSVSPSEAAQALRNPDVTAVLAETADFLPLERDLVGRQSAILLNAIGEGVCLAKPNGDVVWCNDRFRGFSDPLRARIAEACRAAGERLARPATTRGRAASDRVDVAGPDGDRHFEVVVSRVVAPRDAAGLDGAAESGPLLAAVIWDVTASRRIQQKLEAIDRAGRELLRFDADAIRRMNAAERLEFLEDKIVRFARELLNFDHFTVRLLDHDSSELNLVMAVGLPPAWSPPRLYASAEANGIIGYVAATGRSYICPDASHDPRYVSGLGGVGSTLTIPLLLHEGVIGVFNVESSQPNAFDDDDRRFAEIFARHIAMALHILDLLVVERFTTNEAVSGRVEGEVNEPLDDLAGEAEWLRKQAVADPEVGRHVERILRDVDSIRRRIREVARGPRTILGAERALREQGADPALEGKRILVADDEEAIRNTIRDLLEGRGCVVVVQSDGAGAIAALEAGGPDAGFDLVVSDIKMPDRNGYEVFSAAKKLDHALPVILMTGFGYDPHHSIVRASQEGLQCVLFKPFQVERLLDEVRKALVARQRPE